MNSDDLSFLQLVADSGSIALAAASVGCDSSTISRRITHLEKAFGTRLFIRTGRGLTVSSEGHVLLQYARQVAQLLIDAQTSIRTMKGQGPARIHIVAQPTIAKTLFGRLYHEVRTAFPSSEIHFSEALSDKIQGDLRNSHADIAVMYRPELPGSLSYEPLISEQLFLIAPADFDIRPEQLRSKSFGDIPLIAKSSHHGVRVLIEEMCLKLGCQPNIVLHNDSSVDVSAEMVAEKCGCAVMPIAAAQALIKEGRVVAHSLSDWRFERCITLVVGRSDISSTDLSTLNGIIRRVVFDLVETGAWPGATRITTDPN